MRIFKICLMACILFLANLNCVFAADLERLRISELLAKGDFQSADKLYSDVVGAAKSDGQGYNVLYEELTECGFYPQETRLECIMDIKQRGGYGGTVGFTGSIEHVLFCVDWDNNGSYSQREVVGMGTVQMHDELNNQPPWQYAVYRDIDPLGDFRTTLGAAGSADTNTFAPTRNAIAILSWNSAPTGCNDIPYWGNIVKFRIRFSPIR